MIPPVVCNCALDITHAVVMAPSLCTRHSIMRHPDPALSRGRRRVGAGVMFHFTHNIMDNTWKESHKGRLRYESRLGLPHLTRICSLKFHEEGGRKWRRPSVNMSHVTCHMYCVTEAWRADKTWPVTWACSRGQKIKTASFWINVLTVRGATQKMKTCETHQVKLLVVLIILSTINRRVNS